MFSAGIYLRRCWNRSVREDFWDGRQLYFSGDGDFIFQVSQPLPLLHLFWSRIFSCSDVLRLYMNRLTSCRPMRTAMKGTPMDTAERSFENMETEHQDIVYSEDENGSREMKSRSPFCFLTWADVLIWRRCRQYTAVWAAERDSPLNNMVAVLWNNHEDRHVNGRTR